MATSANIFATALATVVAASADVLATALATVVAAGADVLATSLATVVASGDASGIAAHRFFFQFSRLGENGIAQQCYCTENR